MNFYNMLQNGKEKFPDRILISIDDRNFSYSEVLEDVLKIKGSLNELNILGKKIAIKTCDIYVQLINFLGVLSSNNIPIIVHPNMKEDTLVELSEKEDLIITKGKSLIEEVIKHYEKTGTYNEKCFGVLTSGTTGIPKIIFRSEESWIDAFKYQSKLFNLNEGVRAFNYGSLSFTANLNYILHILSLGGTIITLTSNMPGEWIKKIEKNHIEAIFLVPSRYKVLLKRCNNNLSNVKSIVSAGEKLKVNLAKGLKDVFNKAEIVEYYGTSETSFISYNEYENIIRNKKSVGRIFPEVEVKINDSDVFVKSKYAAIGSEKGLKVNDKGYFDDDGILCLIGRTHTIINKGGFKINIINIENVLEKIEGIEDYIVVPIEDDIKGEEVYVFVIVENNKLSKADIINNMKGKLLYEEIPKIKIVDKFIINASGKVDINKIKEYYHGFRN